MSSFREDHEQLAFLKALGMEHDPKQILGFEVSRAYYCASPFVQRHAAPGVGLSAEEATKIASSLTENEKAAIRAMYYHTPQAQVN